MAERRLKDWLSSYLEYTAAQESPLQFHFWTGVSTIAGALRRKVFFDQGFFKWTPNFYIILVAPSGIVSKSTTSGIGMSLLAEVPGAHFGPSSLTWQSLFPVLNAAQEMVDTMGDGLMTPQTCLTFYASELGTLINPRDQDQSMINWLIDLWDGREMPIERYTKKEGSVKVHNPWVNLIAGTTPNWIAANMSRTAVGGGFTSRCLFIYEEEKRHLSAYPKRQMKAGNEQLRKDLIADLLEIQTLCGEIGISDEAVEYGTAWYKENYERLKSDSFLSTLDGYSSRKQGYVHKLATVLNASEGGSMEISLDQLQRAVAKMDSLEVTMPKVFGQIGMSYDKERNTFLEDVVRREKIIDNLTLFKILRSRHAMTWKEFDERLASAILVGDVVRTEEDGKILLSVPVRP